VKPRTLTVQCRHYRPCLNWAVPVPCTGNRELLLLMGEDDVEALYAELRVIIQRREVERARREGVEA
jgi:hypothetical protein